MPKSGITTGSCAALAAKAAARLLFDGELLTQAEIPLPDGGRLRWEIESVALTAAGAGAAVIKDAGDDPDVTHRARIEVEIRPRNDEQIRFYAGAGVGTVTLPGLALDVGEAAINPGPRRMIGAALREVTDGGIDVTVSVSNGRALAEKTFNPRLGIEGGISILGTSGRVRPFSVDALRESLSCALDICVAAGIRQPVLTPGNIGNRAAHRLFQLDRRQLVEVSNEWGYMLQQCLAYDFERLLLIGHPGKLAKLAQGEWQTHSAQSPSGLPFVARLAENLLQRPLEQGNTVEGLFMQQLTEAERQPVADALAARIDRRVREHFSPPWQTAVVLINLQGEPLGSAGDLSRWQS